ncbi:MAG TPA: ADOP family duplicated permease [Terriglobales bacterium]|nr:ADOP family duplicated permease [Terriglobales bacterium]
MSSLGQDVRFGFRMLAKSPAFALIAILTLALGIGANTAIFSLVDAVMLRALPVANPSQLVVLRWSARHPPNIHGYMSSGDCPQELDFRPNNPSGCSFSEPVFRKMQQTNVFSGMAAFANSGRLDLTRNGPATVINGQLASGDFFQTLGIKAAAGRLFVPSDDVPAASPVAVLNYGYWQSAFGGSRDVMGRTIELNAAPFTIIGVAEPQFNGISPGSDYDVWLPLSAGQRITDARRWQNRQSDVSFWWLTVLGRIKPGTPVAQAQAVVSGLFHNEVIHGVVPLFHAGNAPIGPGPRAPAAGPGQRTMMLAGAPPRAGGGAARIPTAPGRPAPAESSRMIVAGPVPPGGAPEAEAAPKTLSTPADNPEVTLVPAQSGLVGQRGQYADPLYLLMLAVGIILLIACANVAGLMLARSAARQREMAVRVALGASRLRIVRQLLTESVMLSVCGGILGVLFAYWGAHAIVSFVSRNQTRSLGFATGVDLRVLGFTVGISLLTGILFGMAPAFRSARFELTPALKQGESGSAASGSARGKWFSIGNGLVIAQVALAIVVLVGAGLLVRTLSNLRSVDVGFDSHNLIIFGVDPGLAGYKPSQIDSFYRDLQGRLAETPGVKSVSYSMMPLLSNGLMITGFHWPGTPQDQESQSDALDVGPDFFETMHIPLLTGRKFTNSDFQIAAGNHRGGPGSTATELRTTGAPTPVVVNQAFVEKYLAKENPLGKRFGESAGTPTEPPSPGYEIVGVVRDAKYNSLRREIHATMYAPQSGSPASFEVRTAADPQAILPAIRKVVAQVNANMPLYDVKTESEQIDRLLFQERLVARLSGFFAILALVLAAIGLYGLLSYEVSRRTREIGIRMALGAQRERVLKLVLRQGMAVAIFGVAVGIGVALAVTKYLSKMLYDVHAKDPITIVAVTLLLALVAFLACYLPARRATRVDPMIALRCE